MTRSGASYHISAGCQYYVCVCKTWVFHFFEGLKNGCVCRDRKRKRFVHESGNNEGKKRVQTESGAWISGSYKSNLYPPKHASSA